MHEKHADYAQCDIGKKQFICLYLKFSLRLAFFLLPPVPESPVIPAASVDAR